MMRNKHSWLYNTWLCFLKSLSGIISWILENTIKYYITKKACFSSFESISKFSLLTHLPLFPQKYVPYETFWKLLKSWHSMRWHVFAHREMHQAQTSIQMYHKLILKLPKCSEFSNKHIRSQINSFFHSKFSNCYHDLGLWHEALHAC